MNDHIDEFEQRLRAKICVFLALEALVICCIKGMEALTGWELYLHEMIPTSLIIPAGILIGLTIASMRSRRIYIQYEVIHCIVGGWIFLTSWWRGEPLKGLLIFLLLTVRFWIYLFILHK
ncbi:MAG: hypothetical protein J1E40_06685 [Oscillospiraceae bacterium]|nr:hypothetical protein [Oscillospiraceae bacterium]